MVPYDPYRLTKWLQHDIMEYCDNPPVDENGSNGWFLLIGPRQSGKTKATEFGMYPKAAYNPNHQHYCMSYPKWRTDELFKSIIQLHHAWDESMRSPDTRRGETKQITFDPKLAIGGAMATLTASANAGVGLSPTTLHLSEFPLYPDLGALWSGIQPAIINVKNALVVVESTPYTPAQAPSYETARLMVQAAQRGAGRFFYRFYPFWDSYANRRKWLPDWTLTHEEITLLERYGPFGLTKENLAFRREAMATDPDIMRNPALFRVWYPFDDVTCWLSTGSSTFRSEVLARHEKKVLVPWRPSDFYKEYAKPKPGSQYLIAVDPAGLHAGGDEGAFHVGEIWADEVNQVATYASSRGQMHLVDHLIEAHKKYNHAKIYVERNGVGGGTITALIERGYEHALLCEKPKTGKYGFWASEQSIEQALGWTIELLLKGLNFYDADLLSQLQMYNRDKRTQRTVQAELLNKDGLGGRRPKHHWDKVSALLILAAGARLMPIRYKPRAQKERDKTVKEIADGYKAAINAGRIPMVLTNDLPKTRDHVIDKGSPKTVAYRSKL